MQSKHFFPNLHEMPVKPIQRKKPTIYILVCEVCGLMETEEMPSFERHHPVALSKLGWNKWKDKGDSLDIFVVVCPWCHFEAHCDIEDWIGAQIVLNHLIGWSRSHINA